MCVCVRVLCGGQLTRIVKNLAQSTFESVVQFKVLVRQLCNDFSIPADGDLNKLKVMFAPDAKTKPMHIPLNLHGTSKIDVNFHKQGDDKAPIIIHLLLLLLFYRWYSREIAGGGQVVFYVLVLFV